MFVVWYTSVLQFAINEAALSVMKWNKHLKTFEPIYSVLSEDDDFFMQLLNFVFRILKLHETGILSAIRNRYLFKNIYISKDRDATNRRVGHNDKQINMGPLIFAVLVFRLIASMIICVFKIIHASLSKG